MSAILAEAPGPWRNVFWPLYADSCLYDATELEMAAEAMRASRELANAAEIVWRFEPEWLHEREFDTQRERTYLRFRAAFREATQ